jgi:hypothetical protein
VAHGRARARWHRGRVTQLAESGWVGAQDGFSNQGFLVGLTSYLGSSRVKPAFGLSKLRQDNEKGYQLRGDGVGALLGEM